VHPWYVAALKDWAWHWWYGSWAALMAFYPTWGILRGLLRLANSQAPINREEEIITFLLSLCICAALASASHIIVDYCL